MESVIEKPMKAVTYTISQEQREALLTQLPIELSQELGIRFAYLYGSVLESDRIHDVDIGLFLEDTVVAQQAQIVEILSAKLTAAVRLPVDVRVINNAPLSFLYHVLRGRLLLCRDEGFLTDLLEDVARRYLDLAPLLRISTKDAFAA